jgi:hypothetical protein
MRGLSSSRLYSAPLGKLFAMCWLVLTASDFFAMCLFQSTAPTEIVQLPLGIGGAGPFDALVVQPLIVVLGAGMLRLARKTRH